MRHFPKFLGDNTGNTHVNVFDIDLNGNIAMGGLTSATTLTSFSNSLFVTMITATSHKFIWA